MTAPLLVVAGVGTGVGKTHFATALALAWALHWRVAAFKPVETGTAAEGPSPGDDADALERASTFHVKHSERGQRFRTPVAANLAARLERRAVDVPAILRHVLDLRRDADVVVVELAGGLFSPLSDDALNLDLTNALAPDATVLLAQDRLGVLHEVLATRRAAAPAKLLPVLTAPAAPDASTGHNAAELLRLTGIAPLGPLPRAPAADLARTAELLDVAGALEQALGLSQP